MDHRRPHKQRLPPRWPSNQHSLEPPLQQYFVGRCGHFCSVFTRISHAFAKYTQKSYLHVEICRTCPLTVLGSICWYTATSRCKSVFAELRMAAHYDTTSSSKSWWRSIVTLTPCHHGAAARAMAPRRASSSHSQMHVAVVLTYFNSWLPGTFSRLL